MGRVKRSGFIIAGVLLAIGLVVTLQGTSHIPGGLQGEGRWMGLGIALMVASIAAAFVSMRTQR